MMPSSVLHGVRRFLRKLDFDTTRSGFKKVCLHADAIWVQHGLKEIVFVLEPTVDYHKPLGEYLIGQDHTVVLVAGSVVKKNRELLDGKWNKHDAKDAANVEVRIRLAVRDLPTP